MDDVLPVLFFYCPSPVNVPTAVPNIFERSTFVDIHFFPFTPSFCYSMNCLLLFHYDLVFFLPWTEVIELLRLLLHNASHDVGQKRIFSQTQRSVGCRMPSTTRLIDSIHSIKIFPIKKSPPPQKLFENNVRTLMLCVIKVCTYFMNPFCFLYLIPISKSIFTSNWK